MFLMEKRNWNIKGANTSTENVEELKYLGTRLRSQIWFVENIYSRFYSENAFRYAGRSILCPCLT
jgi:hypothetical protein